MPFPFPKDLRDTFEQELSIEARGTNNMQRWYIRRGMYADQIRNIYARFSPSQVLVLFYENSASSVFYSRMFDFLGVEDEGGTIAEACAAKAAISAGYADEMLPATQKKLRARFTPANEELRALLGVDALP